MRVFREWRFGGNGVILVQIPITRTLKKYYAKVKIGIIDTREFCTNGPSVWWLNDG